MCSLPEHRYTLGELGLQCPEALSDFAVCEPFQLLSETCVDTMREELSSEVVQAHCKFSNARTPWWVSAKLVPSTASLDLYCHTLFTTSQNSVPCNLSPEYITTADKDWCASTSTLRGVSQYCPLIKAVWSSQQVTDIVSNIAGMRLKPVMDYELGVCNVQASNLRQQQQHHLTLVFLVDISFLAMLHP